ncbi:MAG TPA: fasciclin domain-containing protein [Candidatus Saccharimonadales bacterium]|nr:fasciclin domain-containing protein [Candidatus Saccharimonadales bacterium]
MNKGIIIAIVVILAIVGVVMISKTKSHSPANQTQQSQTDDSMKKDDSAKKQDGVMVGGALMTADRDIVDNAVLSNDHTTLVAAVKAAGLVETLKGKGPFTVFAPTNEAFAKLPAGTVETLVKPENKEKLTSILTYHVVPGAIRSTDLKDGMTLTTVQGQTLKVSEKDGKWYVNDSLIEIADVISSNGVTHVIDTVMLPK